MRRGLLLFLWFSASNSLLAQAPIGPGAFAKPTGSFTFTDILGEPNRPITVWFCRPEVINTDTRVVFLMHGSNPETARQACVIAAPFVREKNVVVVAPQFPTQHYPGDAYVFGNMTAKSEALLPRSQWAFGTVEHLFDAIREALRLSSDTYDIVGFSGGGQFVQRLVLFWPDARFRRAVACSPGRYALPTFSAQFPYGLRGGPIDRTGLADAFGRDFVLLLGDADTTDREREPQAMAQGENRFARGLRFFAIATEEATSLGVPLRWRLEILHGANHSPVPIVPAGLELLWK